MAEPVKKAEDKTEKKSTETYVLKDGVGPHYIEGVDNDPGRELKAGEEVPLTEAQAEAFKDKFTKK